MDLLKEILQRENKMLNIEKYKDFVLENLKFCRLKAGLLKEGVEIIPCKDVSCTECKERCLKWLIEEYKEPPILDNVEKAYLSAVIKPFRKRVEYICKMIGATDAEYILISTKDNDYASLPYFLHNTMYKCMEPMKNYTLEELGL